jgi:methyl-accepting chemotaxis protein
LGTQISKSKSNHAQKIANLVRVIQRLAEGDLTVEVPNSKDEFGSLTNALDQLVKNWRVNVGNIQNSSKSVAEYTQKIAQSFEDASVKINMLSDFSKNAFSQTRKCQEPLADIDQSYSNLVSVLRDFDSSSSNDFDMLDSKMVCDESNTNSQFCKTQVQKAADEKEFDGLENEFENDVSSEEIPGVK